MASADELPADDDVEPTELTVERALGQRMHAFSNMISGNFYRRTLGVTDAESNAGEKR